MAGVKISALPAGTTPDGTEIFPAVQDAVTVKLTLAEVITALVYRPSPTNTITLGTSTDTFANGYFGPDGAPVFDTATGGIGYWPTIPAETTAAVTIVSHLYPPGWVLRYGTNTVPGTTDMTAAMNAAIAVSNIESTDIILSGGGSFLVGNLNTLVANQVNVECKDGAQLLVSPTAFATANTFLFVMTGVRCTLTNFRINGNQAAFSSQPTGSILFCPPNDVFAEGCEFFNAPGVAIQTALNCTGGLWVNCKFDSNADEAWNFWACSYMHFTNCTFNFNGYGFQETLSTNQFIAFAFALRYRSHHVTFTSCEANQNGRDGMNVNQGSYAMKFIGCLCWNNYDGGFTIAADNTGTGFPGEGESPYDLEYVDCEAYNNYGSGLVAYQPAYNVTIRGGRYYNNYLAAGQIAQQSSIINGIYFASGSLGIVIDTKAYDDRQVEAVTANAAGVLTAPGWVAGSSGAYPRVALYSPAVATGNPGLTFQGYGTITGESGGSVTIATTAFNGVTIASIAAGWYVSQRVQHNGVFFDNNVQGKVKVDGFGFLPGPQVFMGFKVISGWFNTGQNILLESEPLDYNELLSNPTWDTVSTGWNYTTPGGGGASVFSTAGPLLRSPGCLELIGGTGTALAESILITGGLNFVSNGAFIDASVWSYAVLPGQTSLAIVWGTGPLNSTVEHPGGGWRQLRIGAYIPPGTTQLFMTLSANPGVTAYYDTATMRVRNTTFDNRDFFYPTRNLPV